MVLQELEELSQEHLVVAAEAAAVVQATALQEVQDQETTVVRAAQEAMGPSARSRSEGDHCGLWLLNGSVPCVV